MPPTRLILACATVMEEIEKLLPVLPPGTRAQVLEFGLHVRPESLKQALQDAVDAAGADEIILGYGLCSMAAVGLRATASALVIPRVDDCIAIFLGSRRAYQEQAGAEPGTYYLTKGWLKVADTPFDDYDRLAARYGAETAEWAIREIIKNYRRLALINTGSHDMDHYREAAHAIAARWDLRFEEIPGSDAMLRRLLFGPWDESCIVVPPGGVVRYEDFYPPAQGTQGV